MTGLELRGLTVLRQGRKVLDSVDLTVRSGEFVGLLGPNGAGKTTLLRAALGLVSAAGHSSLLTRPSAERARLAAFLPQEREVAWPVSVAALVELGRLPHHGQRPDPADRAAVAAALARMRLEPLQARNARALSGGELARALIARVLAQETPLILADEPVAGLDPAHQIRTMRVLAELATEGRGVVAAIHDLGLAARHCTRLVLMQAGRVVADGPPAAVLSDGNLARVFGIRAFRGAADGPVVVPLDLLADQ